MTRRAARAAAPTDLPPDDPWAAGTAARPARGRRPRPAGELTPVPADPADDAQESARDRYGREIRDRGGVDLWTNSSESVHWWAVPLTTDPDEPEAQLISLNLRDDDAEPNIVRTFPRPRAQVLHEGERRALVRTRDGVDVLVTGEMLERNQWITRCGGRVPGQRAEGDRIREGFTRLQELTPLWNPRVQVEPDGTIALPPKGVQPAGWQDRAPNVSQDDARRAWARWLTLACAQPAGLLAHIMAVTIDAFYLRFDRRQAHTIDVVSWDLHIGKSIAQTSCGAAFGDPDQTVFAMNVASPISMTTLAAEVAIGPVLADESQLFDGDEAARGGLVFNLCQGGQRLRSVTDGSRTRNGTGSGVKFSGVLILTGNTPFVSAATLEGRLGGLSRRYLVFPASRHRPVTADNQSAQELDHLARSAYGWLVPLVLAEVTAAAHHDAVMAQWDALLAAYPESDPEVLRLLAGHLAGAVALDRVFAGLLPAEVSVAATVRGHVDLWIGEGGGGDARPVHDVFLDGVRDYVATHAERAPFPEDYAAFRRPDLAREDNDLDPSAGRGVRNPLLVRWPDSDRFVVLGEPSLRALCAEFAIVDHNAVLAGLRDARILHRAASTAHTGELQAVTTLARLSGQRVQARGYDIRAPWQVTGDDVDQGDGPGPGDPAPTPGPEVGADHGASPRDPFTGATAPASGPGAARTPEPAPKAVPTPQRGTQPRPGWLPATIRRGPDGGFRDVVATVNRLLDTQDKRSAAQVHRHPYRRDEDIPAPIRLRGAGMGTSVHEGAHHWRAELPAGTEVTVLDRNAAYLAAIGTVELPIAGLTHYADRGPARQAGVVRVDAWPELTPAGAGLPHPWGSLSADRMGGELWVPTPTVRLGDEAVRTGILGPFTVVESWTAAPLRAGRRAVTRWEWISKTVGAERARAIADHDNLTVEFLKAVYPVLVSTAGESTRNVRIWRPEIPPLIRSTASANLYRVADKLRAAGIRVVALTGTDEIHVAATPEQVFAAVLPSGKGPAVTEGRGLAEIKVKGGYTIGPDGEPADEWEGSRHG